MPEDGMTGVLFIDVVKPFDGGFPKPPREGGLCMAVEPGPKVNAPLDHLSHLHSHRLHSLDPLVEKLIGQAHTSDASALLLVGLGVDVGVGVEVSPQEVPGELNAEEVEAARLPLESDVERERLSHEGGKARYERLSFGEVEVARHSI